jgi:PAS domain S-box-containing protein
MSDRDLRIPDERLIPDWLQARLLESVRQAVIATDLEGRVTYWNRVAEELYEWTPSEAAGKNIIDLVSAPQMREQASDIIDRLKLGATWSGQFQVTSRHGRVFTACISNSPIISADGRLVGIIGLSSDLSEMKAAQEALRRREDQLADAQRLAHVGSIERNFRTGREVWTDEIYRICELDRSIAPNSATLLDMVHPDDRAVVDETRRLVETGGKPFEQIARIVLPSGREKYVKASGQVLFENGKPSRLLAAVQDITEQKHTEAEIHRRGMQQSTLAQIGQVALSNASLGFLFAQTAGAVRDMLDTDFCGIIKSDGGRLLLVGGSGWSGGITEGSAVDGGLRSQAGYTLDVREPVIVNDLARETRFAPSELMLRLGIASGVSVIIDDGSDRPWGVIDTYSRRQRNFAESDVAFLRALAATLGQAIERRHADVELRVRAVQQSAIAELGQLLLTADVDVTTFERAAELVMDGLGVEFSQFLESDDDGQTLRFNAGHTWLKEIPDPIPMDASQAGYSMRTGGPVVISDYATEKRFGTELFVGHGIRTGIAVPVVGPTRKFGVLTAQTRSNRKFSDADVHFMESLAAILVDAMTRELSKRDLTESEERFRSVVEGASEIIFSVSAAGEIISLNPAFEAITGWCTDEWIGRPFGGLVSPEHAADMGALFASIIEQPRPIRVEAHVRGKKGRQLLLDVAVSPKVVRGVVVELYGFARDVTEERLLEEDRNRITRQLQLILDSTDEGIYATNVEGRCTLVNRSAARLLGASPDWLIGTDMHSLIHPMSPDAAPSPAYDCAILNVVRTAQSHSSRDDIFCRADGSPFPVEYTASPIIDGGEVKGSVVAFRDVSVRHKLESKLEQANRLSSLGRLAATVAHEFNNVLMGIGPFAEVLRRDTLSERGNTAVEQIARSVKRGKRITEDILRFTQPAEPVLVGFDASAWLNTIVLEARTLIGPKYTIDVDMPPDPVQIVADASQMHQSFMNLILNARDSMADGGRIVVRIVPYSAETTSEFAALQAPHRFAHFIVEDSGHGMSPETLRHIFEPLFTTKKNGTGLGLSVSRHVITRHGGEIFVESVLGVGTKFHLFVPLQDPARTDAPVVLEAQPRTEARRYRRLLLVEDERPVATGLAALLELEGLMVRVVENGRDVLSAMNEQRPDAVILDIGLPDIDGTKVFTSIMRVYPDMPVVFSSGHADESKLEAHLARSHVGFLLKPYDIETLLAALDRVVSRP